MKLLTSTALFALVTLGAIAEAKTTSSKGKDVKKPTTKKTTPTPTPTPAAIKKDAKKVTNKTTDKKGAVTEWVTEYVTVNDCSPCVVTAWTQCITSTTKSTYPTSTYCAQPGWYDQCNCQVDYPQWIYFDTPCDVEYICPYQDWYYLDTKVVTVVVKVDNKPCNTVEEQWNIIYAPTVIYAPTTVVTYISSPTIVVINNI